MLDLLQHWVIRLFKRLLSRTFDTYPCSGFFIYGFDAVIVCFKSKSFIWTVDHTGHVKCREMFTFNMIADNTMPIIPKVPQIEQKHSKFPNFIVFYLFWNFFESSKSSKVLIGSINILFISKYLNWSQSIPELILWTVRLHSILISLLAMCANTQLVTIHFI